jgi:hypothetical protein
MRRAKMNGSKKAATVVVADAVIATTEAEKEALLGMLDAEDDEPDDGVYIELPGLFLGAILIG